MSNIYRALWAAGFLAAPLLWHPSIGNSNVLKWMGVYVLAGFCIPVIRNIRAEPAFVSAALLVVWAAITLLWSPDPAEGFLRLVNLFALFAVFVAVAHSDLPLPFPALALAVVGFGATWPEVYGGFGNENFLSHALILCVPFCLTRRWWPVAALSIGYLVFDTDCVEQHAGGLVCDGDSQRGTEIWVFLSLAYAWGVWRLRKVDREFALIVLLLPVAILISVGFNPDVFGVSALARAEIWFNSFMIWLAHPWGTGLGGFNYWYPLFEEAHLAVFESGHLAQDITLFAGAAHNDWLQLLVVLGPVGVLLAALFVRAVWSPVLLVPLVMAAMNFPLQLPASALLVAAIVGLNARTDPVRRPGMAWLDLPWGKRVPGRVAHGAGESGPERKPAGGSVA